MYVKDIMTINIISVDADSPIQSVAKIMRDNHIGLVPVCDEGNNVIGVITDRDIVLRYVAEDENNKQQVVRNIMTSNPTLISRDITLKEATDVMARKRIRRLPVIDKSGVIGMISLGDISQEEEEKINVGEALSKISQYSSSEN
ncbi:MAG: CBS domain-containing protein [Clostridium sp.]